MPSHGDHFMKVVKDETSQRTMGECLKKHFKVTLAEDHHHVWFNKAEMSVTSGVSATSSESEDNDIVTPKPSDEMNSGVTISIEHAPVSLDDEDEVFKLFRESFRKALLDDKPHLEVKEKHNKELFKTCFKRLRYDCKRNSRPSKGKLVAREELSGPAHFRKSGKLPVTIEKRKIEEISKTVTSNTEGGFNIAVASLKQALQASFSSRSGDQKSNMFKFDLDFTIAEGEEADVTPVVEIYEMETELIGLSVMPPPGSKLTCLKGDRTKLDVDIPEGKKIKIFGTYHWLHTPIDALDHKWLQL